MAAVQSYLASGLSPNGLFNEKSRTIVTSESFGALESDSDMAPVIIDDYFLLNSPYTEREHLLDLRSLDTENALLARALAHLRSLRPDYATAPYVETFNWGEVMGELERLVGQGDHKWKESSFFIVAFRSRIPPTTVYAELGALDKAAHAEATASGGFLKYWFGSPDGDGRNLATCLWRSLDDAKKGGIGPAHRKAAGAARHLYADWRIDRHRLIIRENLQSWEIVEWAD